MKYMSLVNLYLKVLAEMSSSCIKELKLCYLLSNKSKILGFIVGFVRARVVDPCGVDPDPIYEKN